jgi:hypothetical protein
MEASKYEARSYWTRCFCELSFAMSLIPIKDTKMAAEIIIQVVKLRSFETISHILI